MNPYERNLLMELRAMPVMGPVVSSERITSRKGVRNSLGDRSSTPGRHNTQLTLTHGITSRKGETH